MRTIRHFLRVAKEDRDHTDEHVDCLGCAKVMAIYRLVGGKEIEMLLDHTGKVLDTDSMDAAFVKVEIGIKGLII